jgi:hypothetical protein
MGLWGAAGFWPGNSCADIAAAHPTNPIPATQRIHLKIRLSQLVP